MNRRMFLTFSLGVSAGTMLTPIPWKMTDDIAIWTQNWKWNAKVPKRAVYFSEMASKLDPSGVGVKLAINKGNAVHVAGNTEHPLGKGALSSLAVAEVSMLRSPSRVREPLLKTKHGFQPISWEKASGLLEEKLADNRNHIDMISGDDTGSVNEIFSALMKNLGGNLYMMPGETKSAVRALHKAGQNGRLGYDIENADYVLFLGADALESSGTSVRNAKAFAASHPTGKKAMATYVYAGPVQNATATVSDTWIQARPGAAATIALGLAGLLIKSGQMPEKSGFQAFKNIVLSQYTPAFVERTTGVRADALSKLAKELRAASRPLVIAGAELSQNTETSALLAAIGLNTILGNVNQKGGMQVLSSAPTVVSGAENEALRYEKDLIARLKDMQTGKKEPGVLMIYDANPVYTLPGQNLMAQAMQKAKFVVSFSSFMDETAQEAHLILPNSLTAERFDDLYTPYGAGQVVYSVNRPLIRQKYKTKSTADVLLRVAQNIGIDLGFSSFKEVLKAKAYALGADFAALRQGKAWTQTVIKAHTLNLAVCAVKSPSFNKERGLALAPLTRQRLGTDKVALPPHSRTTISEQELSGTYSVALMNAKTARQKNLKAGEIIKLNGEGGEMQAKVQICEQVMTGVIATATGLGRTAWDNSGKGLGDNAHKVLAPLPEAEAGLTTLAHNHVNIIRA